MTGMGYSQGSRQMLEDLWRAKVEAAAARYSENPSIETKSAYLGVLDTFADLVLRAKRQEVRNGAKSPRIDRLPKVC